MTQGRCRVALLSAVGDVTDTWRRGLAQRASRYFHGYTRRVASRCYEISQPLCAFAVRKRRTILWMPRDESRELTGAKGRSRGGEREGRAGWISRAWACAARSRFRWRRISEFPSHNVLNAPALLDRSLLPAAVHVLFPPSVDGWPLEASWGSLNGPDRHRPRLELSVGVVGIYPSGSRFVRPPYRLHYRSASLLDLHMAASSVLLFTQSNERRQQQ